MSLIRICDLTISFIALTLLSPVLSIVVLILFLEHRKPFFLQQRVGEDQVPFTLVKFRTMKPITKDIPTHEVSSSLITKSGKFLRSSKLDELPQLINVAFGKMSLVGPRPCLPSQVELIELRKRHGVFKVKPGITGLAQVKQIDMSTPTLLAEIDGFYVKNRSNMLYFKLLLSTLAGKGQGDKVKF